MIHPTAWLTWVGATLMLLSATRNPLYLALVLAWIALVTIAVRPVVLDSAPIPISPLRFGLFVVTLSALFNALTIHFGQTALLHLPRWLPVIGGAITLEALAFGALNGLVLTGIFAAFSVLNRALSIRAIVRLIPQAFYPVAVVVSIAVTFVPATLRHFQQIRQAQAVRGHQVRGLRDWLPLLMPLLVGGLERALQLAEAMTARGFASTGAATLSHATRGALVVGLILLLAGWLLRLVWGQALLGLLLLGVSVALIGGALWWVGRQVPRTVYRPQRQRWPDWAVVLGALLPVLAFWLPWPGLDQSSIFYYPYPALIPPTFHLLLGVATLGLLGPALATKLFYQTTAAGQESAPPQTFDPAWLDQSSTVERK